MRLLKSLLLTLCVSAPSLCFFDAQPSRAQSSLDFQCYQAGEYGFTIFAVGEFVETPILTVPDASLIRQSCEQIAYQLSYAVSGSGDLSELLLATGTIGRRRVICYVYNDASSCNNSNLVMDIPSGQDPNQFLDQILDVAASTYSVGSAGQQTRRRTYAKFGEAVQSLPAAR